MGQYLHWKICNHYQLSVPTKWFEHHPQPVAEGENVSILWDFSVNTDRTTQANRPDITINDFKEQTCLLIDMNILNDQNIAVKEFDKLSKYKDLEIEICRMWNLKATTVPVIVGALGMTKKGLIQQIVLTSTAHILRKTLSI